MKTIHLLLIVAAIIAGVTTSCEKEDEMMEVQTQYDSLNRSTSKDTIQKPACADSIHCTCADSTHCTCADSNQFTHVDSPESFPNVSGAGEITTQAIHLADFTEVELRKIGEVEILSGSEYKVEISDYENLLSYAKVYLEGKRLVISYDSVQVMGSKLKISITMPNKLTKAIVSGSGNIFVNSGFASDSINLLVSGAGNILASNIISRDVNILLSGAGTIEAKGTTGKLTLGVRGSGTIKCKELICSKSDCDIRGVCTVFVSVTDKLKVNAFVVGSLTYYGTPILEVNKGELFSLIKG